MEAAYFSMPAIVKVLPEPVCPYMKQVEQPPDRTFSSKGCTPLSQTSCVPTPSPNASLTYLGPA